ncbi:hypothetical protein ACLOJK_024036 [Asimina triloba]
MEAICSCDMARETGSTICHLTRGKRGSEHSVEAAKGQKKKVILGQVGQMLSRRARQARSFPDGPGRPDAVQTGQKLSRWASRARHCPVLSRWPTTRRHSKMETYVRRNREEIPAYAITYSLRPRGNLGAKMFKLNEFNLIIISLEIEDSD